MAKRSAKKASRAAAGPRFIRPIIGPYRGQRIFAGDDYDQAIAEGWAVDAADPDPTDEIEDIDGKLQLAAAMSQKWADAGGPTGAPNIPSPVLAPILTAIDPNTAEVGAADLTMTATGENFDETSVIVANDTPVATTFVSDTELTTVVRPAGTTAGVVSVHIATGSLVSDPLEFTFTDPVEARRARR
jgi:hypothetical protein